MCDPQPAPQHGLKHAAHAVKALGQLTGIVMPRTTPPPLADIVTIAIMSMPMIEVKYDGFVLPDSLFAAQGGINSFYVRWLEAAGVRCYILQWDDPWEVKLDTLKSVKGVLLPGGDLDHFEEVMDKYFAEVRHIYEFTLAENARGNPFFLWGTCQGFQLLCAAASHDLSVVEPGFTGVLCKMLPLELEDVTTPLFGTENTPAHILACLRVPSTLNVHRYGVTPASFAHRPALSAAFTVVSTNVDGDGRRFVSSIAHKSANIFGLQWHAEWPPFDFTNCDVGQSAEAIAVSSYVAQFVRARLALCKNHFRTLRAMEAQTIERSPVSYEGFGWEMFWVQAVKRTPQHGSAKAAAGAQCPPPLDP